MASFSIQTRTLANQVGLAFENEGDVLVATQVAEKSADAIVQAFDPARDVCYWTPMPPTSTELEEELRIHFPNSFTSNLSGKAFASTVGRAILMQVVDSSTPAISPLSALRCVLEAIGTVNSAILQADNGGLLFVQRAGEDYIARKSVHSVAAFLNLTYEEREQIFPDFSAQEVILSGSDLGGMDVDLSDPLLLMRKIGVQDFVALADIAEDLFETVNTAPHLYTLTIGAASIFAEIRRHSRTN